MNALIARALRVLSCCAVFAAALNLALVDGWIVPAVMTAVAIGLAATSIWVQQPDRAPVPPASIREDARPGHEMETTR